MESTSKFSLIIGVFIVILGTVLLLNNLGITDVNTHELFSAFWPLILIGWGLDILFEKGKKKYRTGANSIFGFIVLVLGILFLGRNLDLFYFDFSIVWKIFWPAIFILIGLNILRGSKHSDNSSWAIMSGFESKNENWILKDKSYFAFMGGIGLDLTVADIPDGEVFLDITAIMGGIEVKAPSNLPIVCYGTSILGGVDFFEESTGGIFSSRKFEKQGNPESTKKVIIYCRSIMGGIEIKK